MTATAKKTTTGKEKVVINKNGKTGEKTLKVVPASKLDAMMKRDAPKVNAIYATINETQVKTFDQWLEIGAYLIKWKAASTSKNNYGEMLTKHKVKVDKRLLNFIWKCAKYKKTIVPVRRQICPHMSNPRSVWNAYYNSLSEKQQGVVDAATGRERKPAKPGKEGSAKPGKEDPKPGKEDNAPDITSASLTGAKELKSRLQGYNMALNAITIDYNNGDLKDDELKAVIKHLEATLAVLKD